MLDGRQEEDKVVAEHRFGWIFLIPSPHGFLPGTSLLFGPSGLAGLCSRGYWVGSGDTHTHMSESGSCWRWAGAGGTCQAPGQEPLGEGRGEWGSPICSSKQGTKPGLWGDPNTGAGFPVKAQSMSGEGEEQHFMWSTG